MFKRHWSPNDPLAALGAALLALVLAGGCDLRHHGDDDDDSVWIKVAATMAVTVRDYDTNAAVYGAKVKFYLDSGNEDDISIDEDRPFMVVYTGADGQADLTAKAWLRGPDQCIAMKAVGEYSDWYPASTDLVKFYYPDGGGYTATLYLDKDSPWWAPTAATGRTLSVPSSGYPTIQGAIAAARPDDRVAVAPGVYSENLDFLGKDLAVVAVAGPDVTVIDGGPALGAAAVSFVSGEGPAALLCGFTIAGGSVGVRIAGASPTLAANQLVSGLASPDPGAVARLERQEEALDELIAEGAALALMTPPPATIEVNRAAAHSPATTRSTDAKAAAIAGVILGGLALLVLALLGAAASRRGSDQA